MLEVENHFFYVCQDIYAVDPGGLCVSLLVCRISQKQRQNIIVKLCATLDLRPRKSWLDFGSNSATIKYLLFSLITPHMWGLDTKFPFAWILWFEKNLSKYALPFSAGTDFFLCHFKSLNTPNGKNWRYSKDYEALTFAFVKLFHLVILDVVWKYNQLTELIWIQIQNDWSKKTGPVWPVVLYQTPAGVLK